MAETLFIRSDNRLSPAEDYHRLRREGLAVIQRLAGKTWTDYNTHDPGITLLEAMCYAITDLGYRTGFDIKDIVAPEGGGDLYTARQVLPCNPVTPADYRKLILDVEGVRNAWVEPVDQYEVPVYIGPAAPGEDGAPGYRLTYEPEDTLEPLRLRGLYKVLVAFEEAVERENRADDVTRQIRETLMFHRNLCEDFITISSVEYEPFAFEAEIRVNEGADVEKINAYIYKAIHDFISPPVRFYSLAQMLEKGYAAEEIFEGPVLEHGFIDPVELDRARKWRPVHLSDLINVISEIDGVIAILSFRLPTGRPDAFSAFTEWTDGLADRRKVPRLDIDGSVVTFSRNADRYRSPAQLQPDRGRVKSMFNFLQSVDRKVKLRGDAGDFAVPVGEPMHLADYFPLQKGLPACYGMLQAYLDCDLDLPLIRSAAREGDEAEGTAARLSDKAAALHYLATEVLGTPLAAIASPDEVRRLKTEYIRYQLARLGPGKKQVLQLRGFLMVFEQVLANYLAQLSRVGELFSFREPAGHTYFAQMLDGVHDLEALFIDFEKYATGHDKLVESDATFRARRDGFLDHLLGRFGEDMTKYTFYMQPLLRPADANRVLRDKSAFLNDYIQVSNYRGKGFDYTDANATWGTDNVEGLKKRVSRLLGLPHYRRETVAPTCISVRETERENNIKRYVAVLVDPDNRGVVLLRSREYEHRDEARAIRDYILECGPDRNCYQLQTRKDKNGYRLTKPNPEGIAEGVAGREFATREEMQAAFSRTLEVLGQIGQQENFHVVEHILLRPRTLRGERAAASHNRQLNTERVELLPALPVPAGAPVPAAPAAPPEAPPYRLEQVRDAAARDQVRWKVRLVTREGAEMLALPESFPFEEDAVRAMERLRAAGSDETNYTPRPIPDGYHAFTLVEEGVPLAEGKKKYRTPEDLKAEVTRLVDFFSYDLPPAGEPRPGNAPDLSTWVDPYSFHVSILVPNWPFRFRDAGFRHLFEKTVFLETPAHVRPHVYWVGHRHMRNFEKAYQAWLREMAEDEAPNIETVNSLRKALDQIRNHVTA
jgi:hypothetical protein